MTGCKFESGAATVHPKAPATSPRDHGLIRVRPNRTSRLSADTSVIHYSVKLMECHSVVGRENACLMQIRRTGSIRFDVCDVPTPANLSNREILNRNLGDGSENPGNAT